MIFKVDQCVTYTVRSPQTDWTSARFVIKSLTSIAMGVVFVNMVAATPMKPKKAKNMEVDICVEMALKVEFLWSDRYENCDR